jgi:hypothetical protein
MERTQNSTGNALDTSQPGREEEVVNQQEANRVTNADESNETTNSDTIPKMSNGGNQRFNDGQNDTGSQRYSEGLGNNSDNQETTPPEIGKEDAEKTQEETPRM